MWLLSSYHHHAQCAQSQTALNPPSRLRTHLFAYSFRARKTAASATSRGLPNRCTGILSLSSETSFSLKSIHGYSMVSRLARLIFAVMLSKHTNTHLLSWASLYSPEQLHWSESPRHLSKSLQLPPPMSV